MHTRQFTRSVLALSGAVLGGCLSGERAAPAASPPTVVAAPTASDRVVAYPEGRYELRGDGSAAAPYYWIWIPTGAAPGSPLPPPRRAR